MIKADFDHNFPRVVTLLEEELDRAKAIYDHHMSIKSDTGTMPIHKNMAKISGSLKWAQELRDRITAPMTNFKHVEHP